MKFRCKVIRHLMSDSVSEMPIFGVGGLGDFSVGSGDLLTFGGAILNYTKTGYCVKV